MNYIGSKFSLSAFLRNAIESVVGGNAATFADLFAGTGAVGILFKRRGYSVIANDIQYYSYALNRHYIGNHSEPRFENLLDVVPGLKTAIDRKTHVCDYLSNLPGVEGFIYKHYCLGGSQDSGFPRQYFSDQNGKRCDAIRQRIEQWKTENRINDDEYYFLLASLLESIDAYANTASVYGAFLKHLKKSAQRPLTLKPAELIVNDQTHQVFQQDANQLARQIQADIVYLDPPYNHRQYAANYHLLETIARYDNPPISGATGLRPYEHQVSDYCKRKKVAEAFEDLILACKTKYIFLSYNNEGLMSFDVIRHIMSKRGRYGFFATEYNRFKADKDQNREYKTNQTTEFLHYVICER